jgi:hypothetical protein
LDPQLCRLRSGNVTAASAGYGQRVRAVAGALPDREDEGVVHGELEALRLGDVEIVALGMRSRMPEEEVERWVFTGVINGKGEGERVRVVADRVLHF